MASNTLRTVPYTRIFLGGPLTLMSVCLYSPIAVAETISMENNTDSNMVQVMIEPITVSASALKKDNYVAITAPSALKSDLPLFETAQSVSVITQKQLQQKQPTTLADAIDGVAGVTTGQYGRRGWDDLTIRGQLASSQILIDGMRNATSSNYLTGTDISGAESIEIVKGPDSVGFGQLMPGGVVNITTKKPQRQNFSELSLAAGNEDFKQAAFDVNYAPNNTNKGAFRLNGRISDQNDATDYVYFKNRYIAPSYTFNLGNNSDLTVLASYQKRGYIRQQGLPLQNDTYKKYPSHLFFGEPKYNVNDEAYRLGYQFDHFFKNGWELKQNFAVTTREADANVILANGTAPMDAKGNIKRQLNDQTKQDTIYSLDTNLNKSIIAGTSNHNLTVGLDAFRERSDYKALTYDYSSLNLNNPIYNIGTLGKLRMDNHSINYLQYLGLYAKDSIKFGDKWILGLAGRQDWSAVESNNLNTHGNLKNSDNAFTGNASVMYRLNNQVAPYASYATSFLATTDLGENGEILKPEKGKQAEVGIKLQSANQRIQGAISYYDLNRKNVSEPVVGKNYNIQIGKQNTKGFEAEIGGSLNNQWRVLANYSYIPTAKITESVTTSDIGKRINHIPKNAYSLSTQYYFSPSQLGWYIGGRMRYEGEHTAERATSKVILPSYHIFDTQAGYEGKNWKVNLAVNNIANKDYYVGTTPNASMVMFGEPRNYKINLTYKF